MWRAPFGGPFGEGPFGGPLLEGPFGGPFGGPCGGPRPAAHDNEQTGDRRTSADTSTICCGRPSTADARRQAAAGVRHEASGRRTPSAAWRPTTDWACPTPCAGRRAWEIRSPVYTDIATSPLPTYACTCPPHSLDAKGGRSVPPATGPRRPPPYRTRAHGRLGLQRYPTVGPPRSPCGEHVPHDTC